MAQQRSQRALAGVHVMLLLLDSERLMQLGQVGSPQGWARGAGGCRDLRVLLLDAGRLMQLGRVSAWVLSASARSLLHLTRLVHPCDGSNNNHTPCMLVESMWGSDQHIERESPDVRGVCR